MTEKQLEKLAEFHRELGRCQAIGFRKQLESDGVFKKIAMEDGDLPLPAEKTYGPEADPTPKDGDEAENPTSKTEKEEEPTADHDAVEDAEDPVVEPVKSAETETETEDPNPFLAPFQ